MMMRIVFMGTGEIALPTLRWLLDHAPEAGGKLVAVYVQPDKPVGRHQVLTPPEIKVVAQASGVPVYQPERLRGDGRALEELSALSPDLIVVMAYGQILPRAVIALPTLCCVNLHASLLPRHRGASPIQASVREGDAETGITLMHVVPRLDAGPMILRRALSIREDETGGTLHDRLADLGPEVMEAGMQHFSSGVPEGEEQNEAMATHTGKLTREDGEIDWSLSASLIERLVRAYDPWPGTMTSLQLNGKLLRLKIHPSSRIVEGAFGNAPGAILESGPRLVIQCGGDALELCGDVQIEGRRRMTVAEFLRGTHLPEGLVLGRPTTSTE